MDVLRGFLAAHSSQELLVMSSHDLAGGVGIPITKGFAGYVVSTGNTVNVAGAL
jgi:hypothetical protein